MLSETIQAALNKQVQIEAQSSQFYLAMASWAEIEGLAGCACFLYKHSDEEREHMLKLIKYINGRGGKAVVPALEKAPPTYKSLKELFTTLFEHEVMVTREINEVVDICLAEKDYTTHNFMQWYVSEQIEEEGLARAIIDKLDLIGNDKAGLYLFDRDIEKLHFISPAP